MAGARPGELQAGYAILGLLEEQPDSISGLSVRLAEGYPSAGWPPNIVHNTVRPLAERELIQLLQQGPEPSLSVWEPSPEGHESFERWRRNPSASPDVFRDELWARLKHLRDESDLRDLIGHIRRREDRCLRAAKEAMTRYRNARDLGELKMRHARDISRLGSRISVQAELTYWSRRHKEWGLFRHWLESPDGSEDDLRGLADE